MMGLFEVMKMRMKEEKKNTTACQIDFEKNVSVTAVNCNKNLDGGGGSLISL